MWLWKKHWLYPCFCYRMRLKHAIMIKIWRPTCRLGQHAQNMQSKELSSTIDLQQSANTCCLWEVISSTDIFKPVLEFLSSNVSLSMTMQYCHHMAIYHDLWHCNIPLSTSDISLSSGIYHHRHSHGPGVAVIWGIW